MDSIREKKFSQEIEGLKHLPNQSLINRIDSKLFPLSTNSLFRNKSHILAGDEYKRCLELFERRIPEHAGKETSRALMGLQMEMMPLFRDIYLKEVQHQDSLKEIAVDTIRDLFDIPEHVTILPDMEQTFFNEQVEEYPDSPQPFLSLSQEEKQEMRDEIQKRVILNALAHGSAMHIWKTAHYIVKEKIDGLDPILMSHYDRYSSAYSWMMWMFEPEMFQNQINQIGGTQGSNSLKFDQEGEAECTIECHGVNFPVLLHEVTKGAMDYLICHGIPKHYSEEQLQYYYSKADAYENEYWHYLMAPSIWIKFSEATGESTQDLPLAIARLTQLSYQELAEVMEACIDGKDQGNSKLREYDIL
jgi:hypothetical protein